jgi:hypothetical protein
VSDHPGWAELRKPDTTWCWTTVPPKDTGWYLWRRSEKWEPVERYASQGRAFSHRYCKEVPLAKLEGEWFYNTKENL